MYPFFPPQNPPAAFSQTGASEITELLFLTPKFYNMEDPVLTSPQCVLRYKTVPYITHTFFSRSTHPLHRNNNCPQAQVLEFLDQSFYPLFFLKPALRKFFLPYYGVSE